MAKCINPECRSGSTPGVIAVGRGKTGAPLINNGVVSEIPKRWAWVACRACTPDEHAPFVKKHWTPEEIADRARLADAKAAYVSNQTNSKLAMIKAKTPAPAVSASPPDNSAQMAQLIDTVTRLSTQVAELLAENARLRAQGSPEALEPAAPVPTQPRKRRSRQIAKAS